MALDVREISLLADYFVICSGNSERQINAIIDEVIDKEEGLMRRLWILMNGSWRNGLRNLRICL